MVIPPATQRAIPKGVASVKPCKRCAVRTLHSYMAPSQREAGIGRGRVERAASCQIASKQGHTDGRRGGSEFFVERGERQFCSLGKLQVGRIIDGEAEVIGKVQRFGPGLGIGLLVSSDVQEGEISERSPAEFRVDASAADGHCQAVGDLKSPERRHHGAVFGDGVKYLADGIGGLVSVNPGKRD